MSDENRFINSGDNATEQNNLVENNDNSNNNDVQNRNGSNRNNFQQLINAGGSQVLQKMGVPKGIADKAIKKGLPTDKMPGNKFLKNKAMDSVGKSTMGNLLGNKQQNNSTDDNPNRESSNNSNTNSNQIANNNIDVGKIVKLLGKKKNIMISVIAIACLLLFFIIIAVVENDKKLSLLYLLGMVNADEELEQEAYEALTGCSLDDESEDCKNKVNFYEYVDDKYRQFKTQYSVEVDRTLIIATLTYTSPYLTETPELDEDGEEKASNKKDYRKSLKQVDELFEQIAPTVGEKCYLLVNNITLKNISCSEKHKYSEKGDENGKLIVEDIKEIDEANYRKYLENTFVIKYYLDNEKTPEAKEEALEIVEQIYELYNEYTDYIDEKNQPDIFYAPTKQDIMVTVTDCTGNITLEQVTLKDYLSGVIYMNSNNDKEDYLKVISIAAKNYLYGINNANIDNMPQNLRIRNCKDSQLYCSTKQGCYYTEDGTLMPGSNDNNEKGPLNDTTELNKINNVIETTEKDFIVDNNKILLTNISNINKNDTLNQLYNKSYKEVLTNIFGGSINEVDLYVRGYPLDLKNNYVTSHYGWRIHPVEKICKYHDGTDIGGVTGDNIYSIAGGVVVVNEYTYGYGNYTIIGHGNYDSTTGYYEYYSLYAHQNRLSTYISVGSNVEVGQLIGTVGSTGVSTGPHLHIEIFTMVNGDIRYGQKNRIDPLTYFENVELTGLIAGPMYSSESACKAANPSS